MKICTKCRERFRTPGQRSTWCRECKSAWQRAYRQGLRLQHRVPPPVRDDNGCLIWQGCCDREGYPRTGHSYAHRDAWVAVHGEIPDDMTVDHTCEVKMCVEPDHLDVCTRAENVQRYYQRRRLAWQQ